MFAKQKIKKCYSLSFPILGGCDLTRALQSTPFQNPEGEVWVWRKDERTEILVSNFGYIVPSQLMFFFSSFDWFNGYHCIALGGSLNKKFCYQMYGKLISMLPSRVWLCSQDGRHWEQPLQDGLAPDYLLLPSGRDGDSHGGGGQPVHGGRGLQVVMVMMMVMAMVMVMVVVVVMVMVMVMVMIMVMVLVNIVGFIRAMLMELWSCWLPWPPSVTERWPSCSGEGWSPWWPMCWGSWGAAPGSWLSGEHGEDDDDDGDDDDCLPCDLSWWWCWLWIWGGLGVYLLGIFMGCLKITAVKYDFFVKLNMIFCLRESPWVFFEVMAEVLVTKTNCWVTFPGQSSITLSQMSCR